jgi:hypothetical protein
MAIPVVASYTAEFDSRFAGVLARIDNVYVADAAAAYPLARPHRDVILAPGPSDALWTKLGEVCAQLRAEYGGGEWEEVIVRGEVLILGGEFSVRINLQSYDSVGALLHSFSNLSSAIAFDGSVTYAAVWAHAYRINVVDPGRHSAAYENALEGSFTRGYDLGPPNLAAAEATTAENIDLPFLRIRNDFPRESDDELRVRGAIRSKDDKLRIQGSIHSKREGSSDRSDAIWQGEMEADLYNICQVVAGETDYVCRLAAPLTILTPPTLTLDDILPATHLTAYSMPSNSKSPGTAHTISTGCCPPPTSDA